MVDERDGPASRGAFEALPSALDSDFETFRSLEVLEPLESDEVESACATAGIATIAAPTPNAKTDAPTHLVALNGPHSDAGTCSPVVASARRRPWAAFEVLVTLTRKSPSLLSTRSSGEL